MIDHNKCDLSDGGQNVDATGFFRTCPFLFFFFCFVPCAVSCLPDMTGGVQGRSICGSLCGYGYKHRTPNMSCFVSQRVTRRPKK